MVFLLGRVWSQFGLHYVVCVMSPVCCASAYATELSLRTFSASAALIGAATFALISDMAARSGSASPASSSSSSRVSGLYSFRSSAITSLLFVSLARPYGPHGCRLSLRRLIDRCRLRRVGIRHGAVGQHIGCNGGIDRDGDVGVDERHRCPFRQLLSDEVVELLASQLLVALLVSHLLHLLSRI